MSRPRKLTPPEYSAILRQDFYSFFVRAFAELNPTTKFLPSQYLEYVAAKLQECLDRKIKRIIINMPPRSAKSLLASVALPAFWLGHYPAARGICVSYGQELSDQLARDCRAVMTSPWYRRTFSTRLSSSRQALQELITTQRGYRLATSTGGALTGRGADFIIIDDGLKAGNSFSDVLRKALNEYFDHTIYPRLNNKVTGCIIIVMHRLHEDDLVGHVLGREPWTVISLPAIAEQDETHAFWTPFGPKSFVRKAGEALHPEREPLEVLEGLGAKLGSFVFASQYQQRPMPLGGELVNPEWFKTYEPHQRPEKFDFIVCSWDTASKLKELNDYSVCTIWGVKEGRVYLLHVYRKRVNYPDLKRAVEALWRQFEPDVILIEDQSAGTQLIQELHAAGMYQVKSFKTVKDKVTRLLEQTPRIENGFVYLPHNAHWLADYKGELALFPNGRHDDQVDSTSQALAYISQSAWSDATGWLKFYEKMANEAQGIKEPAELVPVKAPAGLKGEIYVLRERHTIGADGVVLVSPEAAELLLMNGAGWTRVNEIRG